jgi:hypothetical protein
LDKENAVYRSGGNLSNKKNESLPYGATWMELHLISVLNEINHTQKYKFCMISFTY